MNAVERYFQKTGETASGLAAKIGRAPSTITRPLRGKRRISLDIALEIERATSGAITAADFMSVCIEARKRARLPAEGAAA